MKYASVEEARGLPGVRLVLCAGTPGVWGEAVKAVFGVKGIDYTPVAQEVGGENRALLDWTGQTSAPVVAVDDEPVRISWESFLWLAERLAPEPPLIPADPAERALMFGLTREIAGENGFGWNRRLQSIAASGGPGAAPVLARLAGKYGYSEAAAARAEARNVEILALLSGQLRASGGDYFFGERLSALDLYAAVFLGVMLDPLPDALIPMPAGMRAGFELVSDTLRGALDDALRAHRERVFERHIATPLEF